MKFQTRSFSVAKRAGLGAILVRLSLPAILIVISGCVTPGDSLVGSEWRLVEFQSMDDAIGTVKPADASQFVMSLGPDGTVTMQLDCNRARGTWSSQSAADGNSGSFGFGPLAVTRAICMPPHLDERIARDAEYVRSYILRDGRLYLSLMADGGIYVWEPASDN
jgi:heat shock protein HslJ